MASVIGDVLGPAIGVALSPMAVVGFILMLVSAGGLPRAWAFIGGWGAGVTTVLLLVGLTVSEAAGGSSDDTRPIVATIQLLLGIGLVYLAWHTWKGRPDAGDEPSLPGWMQAIDTVTFGKAVGLGFMLSALNPKNLALLISSAGVIGQASLGGAQKSIAFGLFVLLACLGMLVPMAVYLAAGVKGASILGTARQWMVANNATIMAVLFLILGANVLGKGIGGY